MKINTAARNAAADGIGDQLDAGSSNAYLKIFEGSIPTHCSDPDVGTLLATLPMDDPAYGAASSGVKTAGTITPDTDAAATGTAQYWRAYDSDDTCVLQGSVGTSGADMNFPTTSFVQHGTVDIGSGTLTMPEGT